VSANPAPRRATILFTDTVDNTTNQEMKLLTSSNTVYKLIGPALIEQDQSEALQTVEKRLEFIKKEIERIEKQLKEIEEKSQAKKMEVSVGNVWLCRYHGLIPVNLLC
jgi:rubrerythrin